MQVPFELLRLRVREALDAELAAHDVNAGDRHEDDEQPPGPVGDALEIIAFDELLVGDAATCDTLHEHVHRRLQVDHQVRVRRVDRKLLMAETLAA